MPALPVNLNMRLNQTRHRAAKSTKRLIEICVLSDQRLYLRNPPVPFVPIFPTDDATLQAALNTVLSRLVDVLGS